MRHHFMAEKIIARFGLATGSGIGAAVGRGLRVAG
jgi:hypothetical protein